MTGDGLTDDTSTDDVATADAGAGDEPRQRVRDDELVTPSSYDYSLLDLDSFRHDGRFDRSTGDERPGLGRRVLTVVLWLAAIAVWVAVCFTWVFPWLTEMGLDPTLST